MAYITKAVDRNGNELDYTYLTTSGGYYGNLLKVEDPKSGRYLAFSYNSQGEVSSITDSGGRTVAYTYVGPTSTSTTTNFLSSVTLPGTHDFPDGTSESYYIDSNYMFATIKDGNGDTVVSNTYDGYGRVTSQAANGSTATWAYGSGTVTGSSTPYPKTTYTDYKGNVTEYISDGNRNILQKTVYTSGLHSGVPSGTTYQTEYTYGTGSTGLDGPANESSQPNNCYKIKEVDPNGNGTSWTYDQYGDVLTVTKFSAPGATVAISEGTQVLSATTTYTYDPNYSQVLTVKDPNGNVTSYTYDDDMTSSGAGGLPGAFGSDGSSGDGLATPTGTGNLLKITYPTTAAGTATETFTYNAAGQVLTDTTPDGTVTQNTYDTSGGLTNGYLLKTIKDYSTATDHLNATTQYLSYDAYGNATSIEDPNGNTTNFTYSAQDQLVETDGTSGEKETRNYDADGKLTIDQKWLSSSAYEKTVNVYNTNEDLVATRQYSDATTFVETEYGYDANDNRTTVTDPNGNTVTTAHDERDKPYQITDALGKNTTYDFDGNGNTVKLTDELGHVTIYALDGLNKLEQKTFPDGSNQAWAYDANGNVTSYLTTAGNTISQTYDTRNRMLTQSYPVSSGSSTITNVYDIMGRVLTTTEGGTSLTYVYDALGRNTSFTDQASHVSTYTYDLDGHRLTAAYPSGITVQRAYDASSRLSTVKNTSGTTMATYSYDNLDRTTGVTLANGTSVSYGYDLLNRLGYVDNTLGGTTTRNYSYVYDNGSRVTQITEPRGVIDTNHYSVRNEVQGIVEPSGSPFADESFTYDAGFNRATWTLGTSTTSYAVNNLNQYSTVSGSTAPTWNTDGGLHVFAGNTYVYDALQRLTEVDYSGGKTLFSYDPLGRRVKKVDENSSSTVLSTFSYHYDGSEVAVEYQPSTTWTYYLGLGLDQVVLRDSGSAKEWYYRDGHGSTSAVADNSGTILEQYEYNAQGQFQITNSSGTVESTTQIANDLLYTGRNYDYETGNYFYRARYYNPQLGRFISRDPLSGAEFSQGTNLYAYCGNNYLNAGDPTGMCMQSLWNALTNAGTALDNFLGNVTGTDPSAWQQSAAATIDGLETLGGTFGNGSFSLDPSNQYNQSASMALGGIGDLGIAGSALGLAGVSSVPDTLYHFTSQAAADSIAADGAILPGASGLSGAGVYFTSSSSAAIATLQGATSTEAMIAVPSAGLSVTPAFLPGTFVSSVAVTLP